MKKKIFLAGYINYLNAQNLNCRALASYLDKDKFEVLSMKISEKSKVIQGVNYFNCIKPYKISTSLAMIWGLLKSEIAYFPKHLDTPNWILILAKIIGRKVFTTIEMNMCDRNKKNLIDNFGGIDKLKNHFDLIPNIYGISNFIVDNAKCGVILNEKVLHLGVDLDLYKPDEKKELSNIVFIGNVIKQKGLYDFLDLAIRFPELSFHIIGKGYLLNELQLRKIKNISFHGQLDPIAVSNMLQDMDLLFLPSRSEGFPKVILEAAASGIPSIVYSDYGADRWINHGANGFVVSDFHEVVEIVNRLINEKFLLQSCSRKVVGLANEFSWDKKIKRWEEEINNILDA